MRSGILTNMKTLIWFLLCVPLVASAVIINDDGLWVTGGLRVDDIDTVPSAQYVLTVDYTDTTFALVSNVIPFIDSSRASYKADISDTALVALNLPLHQHDSLYHRRPEFINGTLDLHLDSVTLRVIKLTGLQSGYTGDSCLILKNGVPSIISASAYRVMIGAAAALHQHDSLYFREYELKNGHTDLYLDSLAVYEIVALTEIVSKGNLFVDYDAYITDDLEVGDDFSADSISIRTARLYGASYYVPPAGEQWVMDCMLGLKNNLVYKLSSSEALSFAGAAAASHTHDDRYYTETEINNSFYTKTELTNGSTDLSVADITANSVYANMGLRIGAAAGYAPKVGFNYKYPTPIAYFLDTDAATEAATGARLGFMCQATTSIVGWLDYASSTLTLENRVSGGNLVLETNNGRTVVSDALTVGSVGGLTTETGLMYGSSSPVLALVDNDAPNSVGASGYVGFYCAANDSLMGYVGYGSVSNSNLFLINRTLSGSLIFRTNNTDRLTITSSGGATFSEGLTADSISGRVVKVPGDTSYSVTVTLKDGTTTRGTGTAYIAKDAQRRIAYVSVPSLTGTITASTTTTLTFSSNVLPDPVTGATVIIGPLRSAANDIAGVLWVKNDDKIELHTTNPWGYLAAGVGGVTNTDFSYRY